MSVKDDGCCNGGAGEGGGDGGGIWKLIRGGTSWRKESIFSTLFLSLLLLLAKERVQEDFVEFAAATSSLTLAAFLCQQRSNGGGDGGGGSGVAMGFLSSTLPDGKRETAEVMKKLVSKAQPMPYFDKPFVPRRSEKNPTIPKESKFNLPLQKKIKYNPSLDDFTTECR
ncbi:hypothetical protein SASPL_133461 [Salvia splendens]|uniref:TPX2 C-terminal domain-containing protein n=1 Tax=Salvia splendens TaxID=180675 RepID=A0A8X8ZI46_SALSN|nr:hypothetical protein SASPL_133461 [Salvia splendens]